MALSLEKFGLTQKTLMINLVMLVGAFIAILNQTLLTPALPSIMADMNIGASTAQWLTTGFMLVNGIMIPVTAYLIDRFTTRKLFFVSMGIFTLGTALAAVSTTFPMILAARLLQAAGAGVMMPMGQTILLLTLPRQYRGLGMGIIGLVIGVAPAVGPVISGLVVESFGWHILFKAMVPLALLTIVFAYFFLENMGETSHITLDMPSVMLSTLGFGGLLYSFSALGSYGFNSMVAITLLIGVISLIMFVHRQLHMEQPLLKMDILKNHRFALSVVLTMLVQAALNVGVVLNPIYIQTIRGFGASVSGFLMLPASIAMLIMSPISGRLFDKFGPRRLAIPGLFLTAVFTIPMVLMDENTSLYYLAFVYTVRTIGLSMVNMPLNTWGLNSLDNRVMAHGTAIGNTFRQVAGSLGTAILITVMSIVVANSADPTTIQSQIHGVNMAYFGAAIMMFTAFILTILFVKNDN
ncbi:MAG: multidrug efflux MFS transporter [Peptococcaceae bacterium]|nr:multidrug efflux MFS transporter [Peptococcaceae bacterium]